MRDAAAPDQRRLDALEGRLGLRQASASQADALVRGTIVRYEPDGTASERASFSERGEGFVVGTRWSLDGTNVLAAVRDSGQAARIDDYSGLKGAIAEAARRAGIRSRVGIPIVVAGDLWGAMVVSSTSKSKNV